MDVVESELVDLQRRYGTPSFLVGERSVEPNGCPPETVARWRDLYAQHVRRAMEGPLPDVRSGPTRKALSKWEKNKLPDSPPPRNLWRSNAGS